MVVFQRRRPTDMHGLANEQRIFWLKQIWNKSSQIINDDICLSFYVFSSITDERIRSLEVGGGRIYNFP